MTEVIVIIASVARRAFPAPVTCLNAEADAHPKGITVRVGLGRLSMQLISATCEDGPIRQYQPAHIRVRDEEVVGSNPATPDQNQRP